METRDQTLSLWSGSADSKTLDYQRTNPRESQIVHTKETTWIHWHNPTTSSTLCRTPHLYNKRNKNTNPIISRQDHHLTQPPCTSAEKQTNKNSAQISPYTTLTQTTGPTWGRQKPKGRKNSIFFKESLGKRDLKQNNFIKNEKAVKYCTNKVSN